MDDTLGLRAPVLDSHPNPEFKPLETIWIVAVLICLMLCVELTTLAYVFVWNTSYIKCDLFYLVVYAQIALWFVGFIFRFYIIQKHRDCLMTKGYLEFYDTCSKYIEIPFYISSIWMSSLAVIVCLYTENEVPHSFYCDTTSYDSPIIVVTLVITAQNFFVIPLYSIYMMKVYEFNQRQNPPETDRENQYMPRTLLENLTTGDVGYRERSEAVDNMLEKQADLIRYYKNANDVLNKKLLEVTAQRCANVSSSSTKSSYVV